MTNEGLWSLVFFLYVFSDFLFVILSDVDNNSTSTGLHVAHIGP